MNRQQAAAYIRQQLNLSNTQSDWSYEQRVEYIKQLAAYIQANPALFSAAEINAARIVEAKAYEPLSSLGLGEAAAIFTDEFLAQGKEVLSSTGNATKNALYIAVAIATFLYVFPYAYKAFKEINKKP